MSRSIKFWIPMVAFQVVFGLTIFFATRQYYSHDAGEISSNPSAKLQSRPGPAVRIADPYPAQFEAEALQPPKLDDPVEISRLANEYFANKQYSLAAQMYEQLLAFGSDNVNTYNNLGITLHYLGNSTEALRRLDEGVKVDPTYQRIWLTLGYVNSQIGNTQAARTALTTAAGLGADTEVGRSATAMLENLP